MDIDVDPFDEHGKTDEATGGTDTTDERIPLIPIGGGGDSQIDPSGERETSLEEEEASLKTQVLKDQVKGLYERLAKELNQNPEVHHYELFDIRGKDLFFRDFDKPLTTEGRLKKAKTLVNMLGAKKLREMDFNIPIGVTARQAAMLNKTAEELPSASAINRANDIEMQEITERAITANKDLLTEISSDRGTQTGEDDPDQPTMRELVGLDKELRSIRGSLKVEVAKKVELDQKLKKENQKLLYIEHHTEYDEVIHKDIKSRIERLKEDLSVREESIDLLKGRLKNQITSFRETIAKVMDKDATLGERIKTLFREQGITIFSILTAIGMVIGVLVEAVLPGSTAASNAAHGGEGGDNSGSAKEWIRNKLKALASLLGKLAEKAGAALPGIIGSVVAWLLNYAKEVVGWISKNLWSLVLLCVWMVYDYMKKPQSVSKKK